MSGVYDPIRRIKESREQLRIEALCFDDMIAEDNPVRAIDIIMEQMEIPSLGFKYDEANRELPSKIPYLRKAHNRSDLYEN
jgi:hypothetical protein